MSLLRTDKDKELMKRLFDKERKEVLKELTKKEKDVEEKALVDTSTGEVVERQPWTSKQVQLIKDTVAKGATDQELQLFLHVCAKTGLDPFMRQIHLIKRWDSTLQREVATIQTGIDGYRVVAERSGTYAGQDEPSFKMKEGSSIPEAVTVTVYRIIKNQRVGFAATAFYDEYVQTKKDGEPTRFWRKMPRGQLAKCAEALALRKAFPNDLSGIYTHEEMEQASNDNLLPEPTENIKTTENKGSSEIPNPTKKMLSIYGSKDKPSYCGFCGKEHIIKDETWVVEHPTLKNTKGKPQWGAEQCYAATFPRAESEADTTDPQDDKPTIDKAVDLENELIELVPSTDQGKLRMGCVGTKDLLALDGEKLAEYIDILENQIKAAQDG